jgi:AcrR family transcriptional regulator
VSAQARNKREKQLRKREILRGARAVMLKKGIDNISMAQVAKACDLSVGTLYLYYTNKEELFGALQEEGLDLLQELAEKAVARGKTPPDKLKKIALAYLKFSTDHKQYFDVVNYFIAQPDVLFPVEIKTRVDRHGGRVLSVVADVLAEAEVEYPVMAALTLWSALHGMIQQQKMLDTILPGEDFKKFYLYGFEKIAVGILT